ncbi:zinc-binding alcohol dehydrogenase family protein [Brytella acorum]|uniref:Zinc-type alcohol dehydrogenase-like protein n=1 Tax=Brytella acorum TaxID=2959299 RepID=A0AA35UH48_9PROT|nr:zinc-binding alcohol dehydrogenase family protein [Brytella acorum]MDF3625787.1 zinc-binding alcohol dehydrogenase family protein [Brytella acorum]CAI9121216.1 zinc-binding alcohol dehydrogenase family protein [Brytella acorum]
MKAVGYETIGDSHVLADVELPKPVPRARDLLVKVEAISINPVDTKVRRRTAAFEGERYRILGWDVAGTVEAVGADVTLFQPGDAVFYAGAINRQGANAEFHCVDERLAGHKPRTLDWGAAAALPLTSVTAWEMLFDRMRVPTNRPDALLVIGGAGGVGSVMIQIARQMTGLTVIATASRPETEAWVRRMGAHHVINHRQDMKAQLAALGYPTVPYIASLTGSDAHHAFLGEAIAPQGHISLIDDPTSFDILPFKTKSVTLSWELMYTRSLFETPDMIRQHEILDAVSRLVDAGILQTTETQRVTGIHAATLRGLHDLSESGTTIGKAVAVGF